MRATIERLHEERLQLLRQRRMHMTLLGLAISLPIHILIIIWLAAIYLPNPVAEEAAPITFELGMMNDETLAAGPPNGDELPIGDNSEAASSSSSSLEPRQPAVGIDGAGSGSLEAAGGGNPGDGGAGGNGTGLGPGGGSGGGGTSFFGLGGRGTRFVYIVDVSGSMATGARMQVAMDELKRSIGALPDFASFMVVLYSDRAMIPSFEESYLKAMPSNVARMRRWLDEQSPMGGTEPGTAFERVLNLSPLPDIIFFLTDGEIPGNIPDYIASRNGAQGKKKITIHTIAFSAEAGQELLRRIARENEGTFRFVPVAGGP